MPNSSRSLVFSTSFLLGPIAHPECYPDARHLTRPDIRLVGDAGFADWRPLIVRKRIG
jgi:hypothetical protein